MGIAELTGGLSPCECYQSNKAFGNIVPYKKRKKDDNKTIEGKFGLFGS